MQLLEIGWEAFGSLCLHNPAVVRILNELRYALALISHL